MKVLVYIALFTSVIKSWAGDFKVFYTPFDAKTSDVISVKNIEKVSMVKISVAGTFEANEILEMIKSSEKKVNMLHLRLKLIVFNDVYYFDINGIGIKNGMETVCIDRTMFDRKISWNGICIKLNDETKLK